MDALLLLAGLGAVFLGIAAALAALGSIGTERTQVARTLAVIEAAGPIPDSMRAEVDAPFADRILTPLQQGALRLGGRLTPSDWSARAQQRLDLAGNPAGWDPERVLAAKVAWGIGLGGVAAMLALLFGWGVTGLLVAAGLAAAGFVGPDVWLRQVADQRTEAMAKAMPDSLDMLTISVESGLAFDAALAHVAMNTTGPLADEFGRTLQEMQLGVSRANALRAMSERTKVKDLNYIVSALVQADALGIPIADVLRVQAGEMRLKRTQKAEETAAKLPVKIIFPVLLCIMPATLMVVLGPAAIRIINLFSTI